MYTKTSNHLRRHVNTDYTTLRTDSTRGKKTIHPGSSAEVKYGLPFFRRSGDCGVSAAQAQVRTLR